MRSPMIQRVALLAAAGVLALGLTTASAGGYGKAKGASAGKDSPNIVQLAKSAGSFNTLIAAVEAAGLTGVLSGQGQGPLTVFAPTDEAFAALGDETINALLADREKLAAILKYHVVAGDVREADVVQLDEATTLNGQKVSIDTSSGVKVNDATVVQTDLVARNGVVHVIDKVLIPAM